MKSETEIRDRLNDLYETEELSKYNDYLAGAIRTLEYVLDVPKKKIKEFWQ